MMEQTIQQAVAQDYQNLSAALESLRLQMLMTNSVLGVIMIVVGYFIKTAWEDMKLTVGQHGAEIGLLKTTVAVKDAEGNMADAIVEGSGMIASAIDRKYKRA